MSEAIVGFVIHHSLDFASQDSFWSELAGTLTAERLYERQWAITLLIV